MPTIVHRIAVAAVGVFLLQNSASAKEYVVGTWNLEVFDAKKKRGFPELQGDRQILPRTKRDYMSVAKSILTMEIRILLLQEINATTVVKEDEEERYEDIRSAELDQLLKYLPATWDYTIGESGGSQHVAILYDSAFVRLEAACEADFPREKVQGKSLFARQPLLAHFTFLDDGKEMNDFVVVNLHLASLQRLARNHSRAMRKVRRLLESARRSEWCIPKNEEDILIAGDLNASMYDEHKGRSYKEDEGFWGSDGWRTLAPADGSLYPETRINGSQIDYIIVSDGLAKDLKDEVAQVWSELATNKRQFRRWQSDHVPVTVRIPVHPDDDE